MVKKPNFYIQKITYEKWMKILPIQIQSYFYNSTNMSNILLNIKEVKTKAVLKTENFLKNV